MTDWLTDWWTDCKLFIKFNHIIYVYVCVCIYDSKDGAVKYWDADRFECILLLAGHKGAVWSLALTSDASLLLSCGADRSIR